MKQLIVFLLLSVLARISLSQQPAASCVNLNPYPRVAPSAAGKWYLVKATRIGNVTENKNTCGFFNTIAPCKCIGVNINSTTLPPYIQNYTMENYGYNEKFNSYALTKIQMNLISSNSSVYNAYVPLAKVNFTISILGTDEYLSWITLAMCDILKDGKGNEMRLMWIITRSPMPTDQTISKATQAVKLASNSTSEEFVNVSQLNCPPGL